MAFIPIAPLSPTVTVNSTSTKLVKAPGFRTAHSRRALCRTSIKMAANIETAGAGMRVIRQADETTIEGLMCRSWGTWGCEPSTFPWTYSADEVCLVVEGDFTVFPNDGSEPMDVKAGDIAYFPEGMSCKWEVRSAVHKYFKFGIKI